MSTSGTTTFNLNCQQIITEALELLGELGQGDSPSGEDYTSCLRTLNAMVKHWQTPPYGLHIWKEKEFTLYPVVGQMYYQFGNSSNDRVADDGLVNSLTAAAALGAATITSSSVTGMLVNDQIGIVLDTGTIQWTTISAINTTTLVVTLNATLTSAASLGNNVYSYTNVVGRALDVLQLRLSRNSGIMDTRMFPLSKSVYRNIPNKTVQSTPVQYFTDKKALQTNLHIYGTFSNTSDVIRGTYRKVIEDFANTVDISDFPSEWSACLSHNLALWVAPKYGKEVKVSQQGIGTISARAGELLEAMRDSDQESTTFTVVPDLGNWS